MQADVTRALIAQSQKFAEGDLLRIAEILRKAENELRWSTYPRFTVEMTLLKIMHMDTTVSIEQVLVSLRSTAAPAAALKPAVKKKT